MHFQEMILRLQTFWAEQGCVLVQPYDVEKGAGTLNPMTFLRVPRPGALEGGLRGALPPAGGRALRGKPQPGLPAPPISGDPEALARGCPGSVSGQPPGAGDGSPPPRHPLRGGQLGASHAGRRGTGLGSLDATGWRSPSSPTSSRWADWRRSRVRGAHLRFGAPRPLPAGQGERLRSRVGGRRDLRRRVPPGGIRAFQILL